MDTVLIISRRMEINATLSAVSNPDVLKPICQHGAGFYSFDMECMARNLQHKNNHDGISMKADHSSNYETMAY